MPEMWRCRLADKLVENYAIDENAFDKCAFNEGELKMTEVLMK